MKKLLILVLLLSSAGLYAQGLRFYGLEERIDDRTSLTFFEDKNKRFKADLDISFSLCTFPPSDFGYIVRIKDKCGKIWNLSFDSRKENTVLRLNEEGRFSLIKAEIPKRIISPLHWTDITLSFSSKANSISLNVGELSFSAPCDGLPDNFRPSIVFGRSDHIIDVPSFAIRNLVIGNREEQIIIPLDENDGKTVHDSKGRRRGIVSHPKWLVRESMIWEKLCEFYIPNNAGVCFCDDRSEFWYFDRTEAIIFNVETNSTRNVVFTNPCPVVIKFGSCFYSDGKITIYEPYDDLRPEGSILSAELNCSNLTWEAKGTGHLDHPIYHHTSFLNPIDSCLSIFGGFGDMLYNGNFYSLEKDGSWKSQWDECETRPFPRYFTASGIDKEQKYLYLFGGMGNECGEQIVGRRYFYDLHRMNLYTGECEKLWDLTWSGEDIVPVRNLIVSQDYIYTLCYPEYKSNSSLCLYRFRIEDGDWKKMDDVIPIVSDKMNSNAAIYFDSEMKKIYASTQVSSDDISSTLSIYSISYPPAIDIPEKTVYYIRNRNTLLAGIGLILLIIALIGVISFKERRRKISIASYLSARDNPDNRHFVSRAMPNNIYLFGGLSILDRNGMELSDHLSPQQRLIFLLLIKYSRKDGISTQRLSNIIWPDKEEEKVKNSRGVAINSLRKKISNVDGVQILFENGRYKLVFDKECKCDYYTMEENLSQKKRDNDLILGIMARGKFLQYIDDPIFDSMKEEVEAAAIPFLQTQLNEKKQAEAYADTIEIADILLQIDPLDENALKYQVQALRHIKRKEDALLRYATFTAEYRKINDSEYPISFDQI